MCVKRGELKAKRGWPAKVGEGKEEREEEVGGGARGDSREGKLRRGTVK